MPDQSTPQQPPQKQDHQPGVEAEMRPRPESAMRDWKLAGKLTGRTALVTGGDSGIGRAVAIGFAKENHGAAGLAGAVGYFVTIEGMKTLLVVPPDVVANLPDTVHGMAAAAFKAKAAAKVSIPVGIVVGIKINSIAGPLEQVK